MTNILNNVLRSLDYFYFFRTHNYNEITIINLTGLVIFLFITIVTYVLMVEGSGN